jgi:hypothetical protein
VILIVAIIASTAIALLRGGRLGRLADLSLRYPWLALAAAALQYPLVYGILRERTVLGVSLSNLVMVGSYGLLLWVIWANRRLPGIPLVGLGLLSNLLVMALNGGWMPITPAALARIGHMPRVSDGTVARVLGAKDIMLAREQTRLWLLSDVFVFAAPFPVPVAFSIGDVLVAAGLFWLLQQAMVGSRRKESFA